MYTEDLKSFEQAPQLPGATIGYNIIGMNGPSSTTNDAYGGGIVGAGNYFIVVPAYTSILVEKTPPTTGNASYMVASTYTNTGICSALVGSFPVSNLGNNNWLNNYVYRLSTTRTSSGWAAAWESIPLTYASEELVENWPIVAPETAASVYGRSGVGPYRAICYGKDKVLAPRWLGDKLTIIDPTVT